MAITAWAAKVLSKLDLLVGERPDLLAANIDCADRYSFAQQRRGKNGSNALLPHGVTVGNSS